MRTAVHVDGLNQPADLPITVAVVVADRKGEPFPPSDD